MGRVCTVCQHPNITQIDAMILRGKSSLEIARQTGLSGSAVRRHRMNGLHMKSLMDDLEKAKARGDVRRERSRDRYHNGVAIRKWHEQQDELQRQAYEDQMKPYRPMAAELPPLASSLSPPIERQPVNPPNREFTPEEAMRIVSRARARYRRRDEPRYM